MEEKFTFYQMPKFIFSPEYTLSSSAKLLYMFMLDRKKLSEMNKESFIDENGNIYIIFSYDCASKLLGCSKATVSKCVRELVQSSLIDVVRHGINEYRIYIKNNPTSSFLNTKNHSLRDKENIVSEAQFFDANKNIFNKNDFSKKRAHAKIDKEAVGEKSYDLDAFTRKAFLNPMKIFEKENALENEKKAEA